MKVIFITASLSIVYIIRFGVPHKETYNKEDDALDISEYEFEVEGKPMKRPKRAKPSMNVKATDFEYYMASAEDLETSEGAYDINLHG